MTLLCIHFLYFVQTKSRNTQSNSFTIFRNEMNLQVMLVFVSRLWSDIGLSCNKRGRSCITRTLLLWVRILLDAALFLCCVMLRIQRFGSDGF